MKLNAAMLIAALMLSGTVLAQSSGPSAGGSTDHGQDAAVTTTGQAPAAKTGDSGPAVAQASRPTKPDAGAVSVNRGPKTDRRREHFP